MKILVISGFLGAGKTTFIKELIKRTGKEIAVLENEFGDIELDSRSISGDSGLNVMDFADGCVCCTKREGFFNSVITISSAIDPEYLIVEPSGVAMLSNIISNLKKATYQNISLLPPVVLVPPASFRFNMTEYPEICKDQIQNAGRIFFTKAEHESADVIDEAVNQILELNPDVYITTEHYTLMTEDWWDSILKDDKEVQVVESTSLDGTPVEECTLTSISMNNPTELVIMLEDMLRLRYGQIVRAKGIVEIRGEKVRFELADGMYSIAGDDEFSGGSQCVFIGRKLQRLELENCFIRKNQAGEPIIRRLMKK